MTRARLFAFAYAIVALLWAIPTLYSSYVRLTHREALDAILFQQGDVSEEALAAAISGMRHGLAIAPCSMGLHRDLLLLLGAKADQSLARNDLATIDDDLSHTQRALGAMLACKPLDGKAWIDYAALTLEREGFSKRSRAAYTLSQTVAPRESWLAQKRLAFALPLAPMFDETLRPVALRDLAVLDAANHYRLNALLHEHQLTSIAQLRAIFTPTSPKAAP